MYVCMYVYIYIYIYIYICTLCNDRQAGSRQGALGALAALGKRLSAAEQSGPLLDAGRLWTHNKPAHNSYDVFTALDRAPSMIWVRSGNTNELNNNDDDDNKGNNE